MTLSKRSKGILVALAVLLLLPLLLEGGVRLALRLQGTPYSTAGAREAIETLRATVLAPIPGLEEEVDAPRGGKIPHPYLGWDDLNRLEQVRQESGRFRSGAYDKSFEILVVGGSVSGLVAKNGAEVIRGKLEADPRLAGRRVVILSHGRGSFKQPQQVMLVAYLLGLGYRPDVILNIDGFNEVALGADNASIGAHPLYPHWPQWAPVVARRSQSPEVIERVSELRSLQHSPEAAADGATENGLLASAVLGRITLARVTKLGNRCGALQDELTEALAGKSEFDPSFGPRYYTARAKTLDIIAEGWIEASLQLDALAKSHGLLYLHVLQPTLHDAGSKPLTESEVEGGKLKPSWKQGVLEGYPRLRQEAPRLSEHGVLFLDGSDTFKTLSEESYFDGCHFRGPGMVMFAERVADELLKALPE